MNGCSLSLRRLGVAAATVALCVAWGVTAAPASATGVGPEWSISTTSQPTNFAAGSEHNMYFVSIVNVGDANADGQSAPIVIADTLPAGVTPTNIRGINTGLNAEALNCVLATLRCVYQGIVTPGDVVVVRITVNVSGGVRATVKNAVSVAGGGAVTNAFQQQVTSVSSAPTAFGAAPESFVVTPSTTQAGAHPNLTTSFAFNEEGFERPVRSAQNIYVDLPPGVIGNPTAVPECDMARVQDNTCPSESAVGSGTVNVVEGAIHPVLLYSIAPYPNEPAAFAFSQLFPVRVDTSVVRDADGVYRLRASVSNVTEAAGITGTSLTFWGVPADNNGESGPDKTYEAGRGSKNFGAPGNGERRPFMRGPTSCGGPLSADLSLVSWPYLTQEGTLLPPAEDSATATTPAVTGCEKLVFEPSISVSPDEAKAGAPAGYSVDVHVPQNENPDALATPDLKDAVVTLPPGVVISPSAADGLQACSEEQIVLATQNPPTCPDASKVGTVEVQTPLLTKALQGSLYLAAQNANPFGSLLAMYLVAEGSGVVLKLPGEVHADPATGQLSTSFLNNPQLPFSDLRLHFNGGARAPLSNPPACGPATSNAALTPWSGGAPATPSSTFTIGAGCQAPQFKPSFAAGTTNGQAGGFSPLSVTFARTDADEAFGAVSVTTPPGLLGILKSVALCEEPLAAQGKCGAGSLIGHTMVGAGPGPTPFYLGGQVFLTGPYHGAPFGLSIVVPAVAGPFNLGNVVVRAAIAIDPSTSQLTITSDPLPTIIDGIPLQVRTINVLVDRPGFMFDPTNCEPMSITGTLGSTHGASAPVSAHFQVANCQGLPFKPKFAASSQAKTSRANGASLQVKIGYAAGEANIHSVAVTLPKQLPARLSTIQQACPAATFAANPAACPIGSLIGAGTASTPILAQPLTGPAYLVSHGGAAFPDVVIVLEGQGIRFDLTGNINITKKGITSSTFASVPDAPISSFKLVLPEGPHSGLAAVGSLCASPMHMPTTITAQNGVKVQQDTAITMVGCAKKKKKK